MTATAGLIFPSLENEIRSMLTENASEQAISVFSMNLRHLLMQPPVKGAVTLGLDPAYRTGCKIAVVDETGKVLDTTVIYPTPPQNKKEEAKKTLKATDCQAPWLRLSPWQRHSLERKRNVCSRADCRSFYPACLHGGQRSGRVGVFGVQAGG